MPAKNVLAIDFGTSNTYYSKCPGDKLIPEGIDFGDGRDGLATAILYRKNKTPLIGNKASEEYGEATQQESRHYKFRTYFKPEIVSSDEARKNAVDFLSTVLVDAKNQFLDIDPKTRQVIFGIPCQADETYRQALTDVAEKAGYGRIRTVPEPIGAVIYHLKEDLPVQDALKGFLAVDFGGGTCDFAFLRNGKIKAAWGDMHLGGRLFDDLFYQWLLESNPDAYRLIKADTKEFFVSTYLCREIKESFSQTMARNQSEQVSRAMRHYGRIKMTWEDFVNRAKKYTLSDTFKKYLIDIGQDPTVFPGGNGEVDLLKQFHSCMVEGLRKYQIDKHDIRFVILAGGSSLWPFVPEILMRELLIEKQQIKRSERPYVAISAGLSMWPAQQLKFRKTQNKLKEQLPAFTKKIEKLIDDQCDAVAAEIAQEIGTELFDKKIYPILKKFKSEGGSVSLLKKEIAGAGAGFKTKIPKIVEPSVTALLTSLPQQVHDLIDDWFKKHELVTPDERVDPRQVNSSEIEAPAVDLDLMKKIEKPILAISSVIGGAIFATIAAGEGVVLIVSGPIGWLIGLIVSMAVFYLAAKYGMDKAREIAQDWHIPKYVIKATLTERKIKKAREKLVIQMENLVKKNLRDIKPDLQSQINRQIEREIEALNEVQNF